MSFRAGNFVHTNGREKNGRGGDKMIENNTGAVRVRGKDSNRLTGRWTARKAIWLVMFASRVKYCWFC